MSSNYKIPNLTEKEIEDRGANIADKMRRYLDKLFKASCKEDRNEFVMEFLNKIYGDTNETGVDKLLKETFYDIEEHFEIGEENNMYSGRQYTQFNEMLRNIFNLVNKVAVLDGDNIDEEGVIISTKDGIATVKLDNGYIIKIKEELLEDFEGIPIGRVTLSRLGDLALRKLAITEDWSFDSESFISRERIHTDKNSIKHSDNLLQNNQISQWEHLSPEIKNAIFYLPQLKQNGSEVKDDIGLPKYYKGRKVYATLLREMADIFSSDEMLMKMHEIVRFRPGFKPLLKKLKNDALFKTQFFQAFQNTHAHYRQMIRYFYFKRKKYTYIWFIANKTDINYAIFHQCVYFN